MVGEEARMVVPDRDPHMVQVAREVHTVEEEEDRGAHVAEEDSSQHLTTTNSSQRPTVVEEAEEEDLRTTVTTNPGVRTTLTTALPTSHSLLGLTVVVAIHDGTVEVMDKSKWISCFLNCYKSLMKMSTEWNL